MLNIFILELLLFTDIVLLSVLLLHLSQVGFLGVKLQNSCKTDTVLEYFVLLILFIVFLMFSDHVLYAIINYIYTEISLDMKVFVGENSNNSQDQFR